jgi:hypothetical protein
VLINILGKLAERKVMLSIHGEVARVRGGVSLSGEFDDLCKSFRLQTKLNRNEISRELLNELHDSMLQSTFNLNVIIVYDGETTYGCYWTRQGAVKLVKRGVTAFRGRFLCVGLESNFDEETLSIELLARSVERWD